MTRRGQILFFLPALLIFLVFVLIPSTRTLIDSLYADQGSRREFVGALFYRYALTDPQFHRSLANNLIYLGWTLLFEVAIGLALAVGLERQGRLNNFLRLAFFSPAVLSMVVIGLVFGFVFKDGVGLLPGMLREGRALLTISVISGWAYCGFYMVIFLGGLANIPEELLEAAGLDGAGAWQAFWRIKLPLLREVIFVALLICFTGAFKAFDLFWVLLPNQDHTSIVSTLLVKEVVKYDNKGYGSTLAVLLTLLVLVTVAAILGSRRMRKQLQKLNELQEEPGMNYQVKEGASFSRSTHEPLLVCSPAFRRRADRLKPGLQTSTRFMAPTHVQRPTFKVGSWKLEVERWTLSGG